MEVLESPRAATDVDAGGDPQTDGIRHHRLMLRISIASLLAAFFLEVLPDGVHVAVRGHGDYPLPETCGAKLLFGTECPGCGLTRSFIWACRTEWQRSIQANRMGLVVWFSCIAQIPYRLAMIRALGRGKVVENKWAWLFGSILIAMLIGNWALKIGGL